MNHFNQFPFHADWPPPLPAMLQRGNEQRELRRVSRAGGSALLLVCLLQMLLVPVILLKDRLPVNGALWDGFSYLLISVLAIMPGALLGLRMLTPQEHNLSLPFRRPAQAPPRKAGESARVVFAGAFFCLVANLASVAARSFAERFGYGFVAPEEPSPKDAGSFLFLLLTMAVVPAITEELLMRGMIMQPLRRFGDNFALVCSAVLFSLMHQNMVQAPMAFCSGLALGWAAQRTGSLLPPMLIHFWNNAASVVLLALDGFLGEGKSSLFLTGYAAVLGVVGLGSFLSLQRRKTPKPAAVSVIPAGRRALHYFFGSPTMVLTLVYFLVMLALGVRSQAGL